MPVYIGIDLGFILAQAASTHCVNTVNQVLKFQLRDVKCFILSVINGTVLCGYCNLPSGDGWGEQQDVPSLQAPHAQRLHGCQETHGQVHSDCRNHANRSVHT